MSKIEHLNLVRLYGYLEHGDERIIVEEYIGNGTLREHLDAFKGGSGLEMTERLDIAIDIAHAVAYLHTYSDLIFLLYNSWTSLLVCVMPLRKPVVLSFLHYCDTMRELEQKRKERAQAIYERQKQFTKLRVKAEA